MIPPCLHGDDACAAHTLRVKSRLSEQQGAYVMSVLAQATVRCLAANGRLLEIGKYDILRGTPLSMRPMLRNISYEGIDLARVANDPANLDEVIANPSSSTPPSHLVFRMHSHASASALRRGPITASADGDMQRKGT